MQFLNRPVIRAALIALTAVAVFALLGLAGSKFLAARTAGDKNAVSASDLPAPVMSIIELLAAEVILAERRALQRTLPVNSSLRALQQFGALAGQRRIARSAGA